jgi:large subunit ribosomal protein L15
MQLHEIKPAKGSRKRKKRVGLGIAAGQGKTGGRGQKGQKSRSGGVNKRGFEGGQFKMVLKLPFMRGIGFSNPYKITYAPINVSTLQELFQAGSVVNPEALIEVGLTHRSDKYIAVLGMGDINVPLNITAHKFSKSAEQKIVAAGGTVTKLEVKRGGYRTS